MDANFLIALVAVIVAAVAVFFALRQRGGAGEETARRLVDAQASLAGRLSQLAESQAAAQSQLAERLQAQERALTRTLDERLAEVTRPVGDSLPTQATDPAPPLGALQARLAVINKKPEKRREGEGDVSTCKPR